MRPRRKSAWRLLGRLIVAQRRGVAAAVASGLTWQGTAVTAPAFAGYAVNEILDEDAGSVYFWATLIAVLGLVEAGAGVSRHIFAIRNRAYTLARVRDLLLRQSLRLDARYHDRFPPGELMSRASSDAELTGRILDSLGATIGYVATVIGAAAILVYLDPTLALVVLLPLPVLAVGFWRYARRYVDRTHKMQEELGNASALIEETVAGIRVVKGLGAGDAMSQRFRGVSDRIFDRAMAVARVDAVFLPALEVVPLLSQMAVLWFGGQRVLSGDLTVGEFVAFNGYVIMLVWPMRVIGQRVSTLQNALAAAERIVEPLEVEASLQDPVVPKRLPGVGDLRFENVTFAYGDEPPVLDGFTLHVEAGRSVALAGPTGSGKSTIAALLVRFYDPQEGRVMLDGIDLRDVSLRDVRRNVALVSDETYLFSDTIRANIAFGRPDATDEEIEAAARAAGAHDFVVETPDGYDTMLGERGYTLSGGQRQRLAIARAILADPAVLVLDDATSSVDASMEHEIRRAIRGVMRQRTTIVIAHRPATIALAEHVVLFDRGRVVDEGTHDELVARSARYRALLALDREAAG